MTRVRTRRRGIQAAAAFAIVAAGLIVAALPGTAAASRGAATIRGIQLAAGTCPDGGYAMTGSLEGCWWIETFDVTTDPAHHNFRATGTERFEGWFGGVQGTFHTVYEFTAKMDGPWGTSTTEIHGRCHHPVTGGEGGFAGITGEISFHDVVVDPPYYPYWGNLRLPGAEAQRAGSTARSASSGAGATLGGRLPRVTSSSATSAVMPC